MIEQNSKQFTNIRVYVRVKPTKSTNTYQDSFHILSDCELKIGDKQQRDKNIFTFDRIINQEQNQADVYQFVGEKVLKKGFQGINSTILCYGQTGAGKTYTSVGPDYKTQERGLFPRMIENSLKKMKLLPSSIQAKLKISLVEIYNEKIKDLLDPSKDNLKILSTKSQGIFLSSVTEKYINSEQEAFYYLNKALINQGSPAGQKKSNRAHTIMIMRIQQHDFETGLEKSAKIIVGDLAGNDKINRNGEQKWKQENKRINRSLSALSKVIHVLSDDKKVAHIPYRQSKLTRLLQESLGGNSITKLILNVRPEQCYENETMTSLRFGMRAKLIKNEPKVQQEQTITEVLELLKKAEKKIKQQNDIINELKKYIQKNLNNQEDFQEIMNALERRDSVDQETQSLNFMSYEQSQHIFNNQSTQSFQENEYKENMKKSLSTKHLLDLNHPQRTLITSRSQRITKYCQIEEKYEFDEIKLQLRKSPQHSFHFSTLDLISNVVCLDIHPCDQIKKIHQDPKKNNSCIEENLLTLKRNLQLIKSKQLQKIRC